MVSNVLSLNSKCLFPFFLIIRNLSLFPITLFILLKLKDNLKINISTMLSVSAHYFISSLNNFYNDPRIFNNNLYFIYFYISTYSFVFYEEKLFTLLFK